jgi:hypothetical protein
MILLMIFAHNAQLRFSFGGCAFFVMALLFWPLRL